MRNALVTRRFVVRLLLVLSFLVASLVAWFVHGNITQTRRAFASIDSVVQSLGLSKLGDLKLDKRSGSHVIVEGQPSTRTIVISSRLELITLGSNVKQRLRAAGFAQIGTVDSQCGRMDPCTFDASDHPDLRIGVVIYQPGQRVLAADQQHPDIDFVVSPASAALLVSITSTL